MTSILHAARVRVILGAGVTETLTDAVIFPSGVLGECGEQRVWYPAHAFSQVVVLEKHEPVRHVIDTKPTRQV